MRVAVLINIALQLLLALARLPVEAAMLAVNTIKGVACLVGIDGVAQRVLKRIGPGAVRGVVQPGRAIIRLLPQHQPDGLKFASLETAVARTTGDQGAQLTPLSAGGGGLRAGRWLWCRYWCSP